MRRLMLAAAVSCAALLAGYGTAAAQVAIEIPGAGVYVGPANDDYYYDYDSPRAYGYYRSNRYYDDSYRTRSRERQTDFNLCGRHSYWNGESCQPGRRP